MQVGWLIDTVAFESYWEELVKAVERNGMKAVPVTRPAMPYQWDDVDCSYRNAFPRGSCVVTHGDIDLVARVRKDGLWTPGVFATTKHFYCSHYFAHFGYFLLNRRYAMIPYGELPRCIDFLMETFGVDGEIFVRPDTPLKSFTGQIISEEEFSKDYEFIGFNDVPVEALVVVSSPQDITAEWRFIIADRKVIAGSQYKLEGELIISSSIDSGAVRFAEKVLEQCYEPDPVWILDIGKTGDGTYHIVEVGGFSFAGLYACDKDAVVRGVSQVAARVSMALS